MADSIPPVPADTAYLQARQQAPFVPREHRPQNPAAINRGGAGETAAAYADEATRPYSRNGGDRRAGGGPTRNRQQDHQDSNRPRNHNPQNSNSNNNSNNPRNKPKQAQNNKPPRNGPELAPQPQTSGDVRNHLNENGNLMPNQQQSNNQGRRNNKNQRRKSDDQGGPKPRPNEQRYQRQGSSSNAQDQAPAVDQSVQEPPAKSAKEPKHERSSRDKPSRGQKVKLLETRAEILIDQLDKNQYECMVCCFVIRKDKAIWSCDKCFHIFHLYCIKKWASTAASKIEETSATWRCPGCQAPHLSVPNKYMCFCGKKMDPRDHLTPRPHLQRIIPHSCGEVCAKPLENSARLLAEDGKDLAKRIPCTHKCTQPCHPGPCPTCEAIITRSCSCGKKSFQVKCSSTKMPTCTNLCDLMLNCGIHQCNRLCHAQGDCGPCEVDVPQTCFSHAEERVLKCGSDELKATSARTQTGWSEHYRCGRPCGKLLACGNHYCEDSCHEGACKECQLLPSNLKKCPCGKTPISTILVKNRIIRTKCTDPIPTCEKTCERILHEHGPDIHVCQSRCHNGECPPCTRSIQVKCRCGKETHEMKCHLNAGELLCERRCNKKKTCGRHQCNELCCNSDHICMLICNRQLDCGNHRCENLCHKNPCPRCLVADFNERVCHCGKTVQYPPIRCGTKPLECPHLCDRNHNCDHPVTHACHWGDECPPCMFLTSKPCVGNHEIRHNIPCHIKEISCGRLCNKPLDSCDHKCTRVCHKGECSVAQEPCAQPCAKPRPYCEHACNSPCHFGKPCPDTVCQEMVQVTCKCGLKSKKIVCGQRMNEASSQVVFENLASELKEMLLNKSIDLASFKSPEVLKKKHELACDEECAVAERNRRFALALDLDPSAAASSSSSNLTPPNLPKPIYSDFLKTFARDNYTFAVDIEKQLESIVREVTASSKVGLKKTYNYPVMKSYERKFLHELASYYGLETMSHDTEPDRYVAIYATRGKCYVPMPTLLSSEVKSKHATLMSNIRQQLKSETSKESTMLLLNPKIQPDPFEDLGNRASQATNSETKTTDSQKVVDYFDMTD